MTGGDLPPASKLVTDFTDKTFKLSVETEQFSTKIRFDVTGDYTFDGKRIKMISKSVNLDESSLPAAVKPQAAMVKSALEKKILTTEEGDAKLEGDVLTVMAKTGKPVIYTRIK
jgi:hypothetical protein